MIDAVARTVVEIAKRGESTKVGCLPMVLMLSDYSDGDDVLQLGASWH